MLRKAFDGEVFYWYEDDPSVRRAMSTVDPLRVTNAKIYTQSDLDRVREEARRATFKEAVTAIQGARKEAATRGVRNNYWQGSMDAFDAALAALAALETAEKGERDG